MSRGLMTESTAPVTVGWYLHPIEAEIARGKLESEGIPAFLHSVNHSAANWPLTLALGGIRLQVPPSAAEKALEILGTLKELENENENEKCPHCGSEDTARYKGQWKLALLSMHFLHIPLPFETSQWRCDSCGNTWKDEE